jgi:signal transduction histidine kinase
VTRETTDAHELDEVTRIVRKMTRGEDGDVAVQDSQGRIIIVHPGNARAYAPYD